MAGIGDLYQVKLQKKYCLMNQMDLLLLETAVMITTSFLYHLDLTVVCDMLG